MAAALLSLFPAFGMESVFDVEYSDQQAERFNGYDGYLSPCFSTGRGNGCAVFFSVAYIRWYHRFHSARLVKHEFVDGWLSRHRLLRSIEARQTKQIASPLTYGIFRPVILIPVTMDWSDHNHLEYVLTHEYVHIRRFDSVAKMLLLLALLNLLCL